MIRKNRELWLDSTPENPVDGCRRGKTATAVNLSGKRTELCFTDRKGGFYSARTYPLYFGISKDVHGVIFKKSLFFIFREMPVYLQRSKIF